MSYVQSRVSKVWGAVEEAALGGEPLSEDDIKDRFAARAANADLLDGGKVPKPSRKPELEFLLDIARESYRYCKHLVIQRSYYDLHDSVRLSILVLEKIPIRERIDGADFKIVVYVVPNVDARVANPAQALWVARKDIAREWGWTIPADDGHPVASDEGSEKRKQAIGQYLRFARVRPQVDGKEVVLRQPEPEPKVPMFNEGTGTNASSGVEDAHTVAEVRLAGMAVSPDGAIGARVGRGGVEFVSLGESLSPDVPQAKPDVLLIEEAGLAVLAVDGSLSSSGANCRALVAWPGGTALVHRGSPGQDRVWRGRRFAAGALLGGHAILVDGTQQAIQVALDKPMVSDAVGWLGNDRVLDLDVLATDGELLVVAALVSGSSSELRVARFAGGRWDQTKAMSLSSRPAWVVWDRARDTPVILTVEDESLESYRLDDALWKPL